jgi:phosphate-selective porin OprO/OprP
MELRERKPLIWWRFWIGFAIMSGAQAMLAQTQPPVSQEERIRELERKLEEMDRRLRIAESRNAATPVAEVPVAPSPVQAAVEPSKNVVPIESVQAPAQVTADTTGFTISSPDRNYTLKIGADLQVDNRSFVSEGSGSTADTILLRRVRPTFSGTVYKYVDYFFRPDFGQGTTVIYDAYVQLNYLPRLSLRAGKFKPPVGLERLQSDDDTNFIERGLPTLLVPSRDIGFQLSGDIVKGRLNYAVGVFNGVPDNGLSDAAANSHRDVSVRLFATPFYTGGESPLSGLGFGIGATGGNVDNMTLPSYKTFGQASFFTFNPGVVNAGHRTRLAPQAYYYLGPFGLLTEYGLTEEGFQKGTVRRDIAFRAWQAQATYILTGEKKGFAGIKPIRPFDPLNHGWGAYELAVRVGDFNAENAIYNLGFVDPTKTPRHLHEWVGGVNWYLNRLVRISTDIGSTNFGGGALASAGGNRPSERVILLRFQINFI